MVRIILPILVVLFIYFMSSSSGTASGAQSNGIVDFLIRLSFFSSIDKASLGYFVRKTAHMAEFALLGASNYWAFLKTKKPFQIAFLASFVVAYFDEFHQLYVTGRSGSFVDIMIDVLGSIAGIAFISIIVRKKE